MEIFKDFISKEKREFAVQFGEHIASSLSGFIAGVVVTSIFWGLALYLAVAFR